MILINPINENVLSKLGAEDRLIQDVKTNPLYFQKIGIEEDGEIIAASLGRITSEITLVFKPNLCNFTIQKVINKLLKEQVTAAKAYGMNQTIAWTTRDRALMQHYGFEERNEPSYIMHF